MQNLKINIGINNIIYIYIICVPMHNRNNEFILCKIKMANFERRQLKIGLEFVRRSFTERKNFSEGFSEPKKDAQVIRVRGAVAPQVFLT